VQNYIETYRKQDYMGFIQAIVLRVGDDVWFYNSEVTITEDLINHSYPNYFLSKIIFYPDTKAMLDITELEFSACKPGKIQFINSNDKNKKMRKKPYYKFIRDYIGQNSLFMCGMDVIIENENNEIAIGKRADDLRWAIPAGAKEINESIIQTVHTECIEELGIEVTEPTLMALFSGPKCKSIYPNGDKVQFIIFLFKTKHKAGNIKANDSENSQVEWIDREKLFSKVSEKMFKAEKIYNSFNDEIFLDQFDD
jgi:ADP-ribose pyrophosphatase YjhB (NUDIX family)